MSPTEPNPSENPQKQIEQLQEELAQARKELRKARGESSSSSDHSIAGTNLMVCRIGPDQKVVYVNTGLCRHLKLKPDAIIGDTFSRVRKLLPSQVVDALEVPEEGETRRQTVKDENGKATSVSVSTRSGFIDVVLEDVTKQEQLKTYVSQYISPDLVNLSEEDLSTFRFPERREMTVAFADLRGFTAMSETMTPEDVRSTINAYLDAMIAVINENRATVDKIVGDEVMSLYGAPVYYKDHALRAVKTACDQIERMQQVLSQFESMGKRMPGCGIGINSGDMVLGNIGGGNRMDYTVLGAAVNLAARLCGGAATWEILLTEATLHSVTANLPDNWEAKTIKLLLDDEDTASDDSTSEGARGGKTENVLPLPDETKGKAVVIGPAGQPGVYRFRYLCLMKVKGVKEALPVLSVEKLKQAEATAPLQDATKYAGQAERIFGKYRLLNRIGRGGMGEVWKARDSFGNTVAIKLLLAGEGASDSQVKRFLREAEVLSKLSHRNVCHIHEVGEYERVHFISMELVDGIGLDELVRGASSKSRHANDSITITTETGDWSRIIDEMQKTRQTPEEPDQAQSDEPDEKPKPNSQSAVLNPTHAVALMRQVCEAVHYAHSNGILHRDLKPGNIFVRRGGDPVVLDFGLAKLERNEGEQSMLLTGMVVGTVDYMSPEQAHSSKDVDERTDVYSLGAILYELLTGERHFRGSGNIVEDGMRLQEHQPKKLRELDKRIPRDLETIVLKALHPDTSQRYLNVSALANDLKRFERGEPISARRPTLRYKATKFVHRHPIPVALVSLLMLAFLCFGGVQLYQFQKTYGQWIEVVDLEFDAPEDLEALEFWDNDMSSRTEPWPMQEGYLQSPAGWHMEGGRLLVKDFSTRNDVRLEVDIYCDESIGNSQLLLYGNGTISRQWRPSVGYTFILGLDALIEKHEIESYSKLRIHRHNLTKGERYTLAFERVEGVLNAYVDGELIASVYDLLPIGDASYSRFGFSSPGGARLEALRLYRMSLPEHASPLIAGDALVEGERYAQAYQAYLNVSQDYEGKAIAETARAKAIAVALTHMKERPDTFEALIQEPFQQDALHTSVSELLALDYWTQGRYDEALALCELITEREPASTLPHQIHSLYLRHPLSKSQTTRYLRWLEKSDPPYDLKISDIGLTSLSEIPQDGVGALSIYNNRVTDISALKGRKLISLVFSNNPVTDISALSEMPDLIRLHIGYTPINDLTPLKAIKHFEMLMLQGLTAVTPELLGELNVKRLSISETGFTNLSALEDKELLFLWAQYNDIKELPRLTVKEQLYLGGNQISNISNLSDLPLALVNIHSNQITDITPLASCAELIELFASNNAITSLSPLEHTDTLTRLHIAGNKVTDASPIAHHNLLSLDLSDNPISSIQPFIENPPEAFLFDCDTLPDSELETAYNHWKKQPNTALHAQFAQTLLTLRSGDVEALRALASEFQGNAYLLVPKSLTWEDAKRWCEERGGHLLTLNSWDEWEFIRELTGDYAWRTFIGGYGKEELKWVTDEPMNIHAFRKNSTVNKGPMLIRRNARVVDTIQEYQERNAFIIEWEK